MGIGTYATDTAPPAGLLLQYQPLVAFLSKERSLWLHLIYALRLAFGS